MAKEEAKQFGLITEGWHSRLNRKMFQKNPSLTKILIFIENEPKVMLTKKKIRKAKVMKKFM